MKQMMLRMLCWALLLCWLCPASVGAVEAVRMELSPQIEALPEFLLSGTTSGLRKAMIGYLNALAVDVGYCADTQRGVLIEAALRQGETALATVCIAADKEAVAFSGDLFPAGWHRIGYEELEVLYPGQAWWAAPLRELAGKAIRGDEDEAAEDKQAQWETLQVGLMEKAGEWLREHPQALKEVDSVISPIDRTVAARRYELDLRGRDLVDFNNKVFDAIMTSEWVRRELRAITMEALPGVEISGDGLEEIETEIMRELKRQLAVELSGMRRPLYGKVWRDDSGRITDADLTLEPDREGGWKLGVRYERMSAEVERWVGRAHWSARFYVGNTKEAMSGSLQFWRALPSEGARHALLAEQTQPVLDWFKLEGKAWATDAQGVRIDWETTLKGEERTAATAEIVLSAKIQRLSEQAAGSLTLRIVSDTQTELSGRFPDSADCVDLGHAPRSERETFEVEMTAAQVKLIARLLEGMPPELSPLLGVLVSEI